MKKIKVLHINTFDRGGAAIACQRIHMGLLNYGIESKILLKTKTINIPKAIAINSRRSFFNNGYNKTIRVLLKLGLLKKEWIDREYRFKKNRPKGLEYFSYPISDYDITKSSEYLEADIIHLHWVAGFLDWKSFFKKNMKPVVWTLHDANPFLGGQHYNERFYGIDDLGNPMERILTEFEIKEEKAILELKRKALNGVDNLYIVGNSFWTKNESKKSELLKRFPHSQISYGYPLEKFKVLNKNFCRSLLDLPIDKKIVLFGADSVINQRKGFTYLLKAIDRLANDNKEIFQQALFCAFGSGKLENVEIRCLGVIKDERILGVLYNAADVFIIPSLEEALGMVAVESLLCGTPVIGFPTGGISETIINGENGILCDEISVDALYFAINKFIKGEVQFDSEKISHRAREKYSLEKQAKAYIELYEEILGA